MPCDWDFRDRKDDALADVLLGLEDDLHLVTHRSWSQMPNPGA